MGEIVDGVELVLLPAPDAGRFYDLMITEPRAVADALLEIATS